MGKGKGSGVTPERVKVLVTEAVNAESQYAVAKKTGLALSVIQRILKGDREPTTATLSKLSTFFGVPVHELRGEDQPWNAGVSVLSDEDKELLQRIARSLADQCTGRVYGEIFNALIEISDKDVLLHCKKLLCEASA